MVDPIISRAAQQAADQATQQAQTVPSKVSEQDQARFEDALNRPHDGADPQSMQNAQQMDPQLDGRVDPANQAPEAVNATDQSYGGAMMDHLQDVKRQYDIQAQKIQEQVSNVADGELKPQDLMKMQFEMMKMSMQVQFVSKGADKVSSGLQTLINRSN